MINYFTTQNFFRFQAADGTMLIVGGLGLVTNRTKADADRIDALNALWVNGSWTGTPEELAEWVNDPIGAYNIADLNRVGEVIQYIADRLNGFGFVVSVSPKTDWAETDSPTAADMERYLKDVRTLRAAFAVLRTTPDAPSDMVRLTYTEANNIEKILEDVDLLLTLTSQAWFYSGDLFSGEV